MAGTGGLSIDVGRTTWANSLTLRTRLRDRESHRRICWGGFSYITTLEAQPICIRSAILWVEKSIDCSLVRVNGQMLSV